MRVQSVQTLLGATIAHVIVVTLEMDFSVLVSMKCMQPSNNIHLAVLYTDIDECEQIMHDCHIFAACINTAGSYNCSCLETFRGNGTFCSEWINKLGFCGCFFHCDAF